jgi:GTP-binding protein
VIDALGWEGPVYAVSAISGEGTAALCGDLMNHLEETRAAMEADPELDKAEQLLQGRMQREARERIAELRSQRRRGTADDSDDDDFNDDDYDVEVEYVP